MRFARSPEICVTVSLTLLPSLLHAAPLPLSPRAPAPAEANVAAATSPAESEASPAESEASPAAASEAPMATSAAAPPTTTSSPSATPTTPVTTGAASATPAASAAEPEPPPRTRPKTWQIYQRPLPGAEHSWGPPNGQMPAVAEVTEATVDPNQPPPDGLPRIVVGAVVGAVGLGVFGLGVAARTTDVLGEDRRAGVPLLGAGLVTAAIGWGLFAHGILRRKAFLRWKAGQATVAPTIGGATLLLRF